MKRSAVWAVALFGVIPVFAQLRVGSLFQDHVVLQRERAVPVWGEATPGEKVTVSFASQQVEAVTDSSGRWQIDLGPMAANANGTRLQIETAREVRVFEDVVVGDVWLCAGQSNMEWNVARARDAEAEVAAANHPLIRHIKIANFSSRSPVQDFRGRWRVCSPETVGGFSAAAYYFARELTTRTGVPIGLINATWGGTPIEAWLSEPALLSSPEFDVVFQRWAEAVATFPERTRLFKRWNESKREAEARGAAFTEPRQRDPSIDYRRQPAGLFGGMVAPLTRFPLRGIAWYQGEDNASRAGEYRRLLETWVTDWRRPWPDVPILLVQLPNYWAGNADGTSWARLREAQAQVADAMSGVTLVVTLDIGDPNDIHPLDKQSIGQRLALAARSAVYGETMVAAGPRFESLRIEGGELVCVFSHAAGLTGKPGEFVIAGEDRRFFPAQVRIEGDAIRLWSSQVSQPVAARYAWRNAPAAVVFNGAGLPLAPFRTDDWPDAREEHR